MNLQKRLYQECRGGPDRYRHDTIRTEKAYVISIESYHRYEQCMSPIVANGKVEYKPGTIIYADKLPRSNNENGIYVYLSEEELRK